MKECLLCSLSFPGSKVHSLVSSIALKCGLAIDQESKEPIGRFIGVNANSFQVRVFLQDRISCMLACQQCYSVRL